MTEGLGYFLTAIAGLASLGVIFTVLWATLLGITVGMLPGLTATLGLALMTTLTFKLAAGDAILILNCVYLGALIGMVLLAVFAPLLAEFALSFQSYEFSWLAIFGVVVAGRLTALEDPLKGWVAGFFGLLNAMVGQEGIHGYGRFREVFRYWKAIIRSGITGTFTGLIPGVGGDMGAWVSYALSRNDSKEKEQYGKGSIEGLLSAETGNSAAVPGSIIPVLTLAMPFYGMLLTKPLLYVIRVPPVRLIPVIFVLCTIGSFAIASRTFDVWVMLGFGVIGLVLRELKFPLAPLILGVVLGPILDLNLRRGLVLSDGALTPFFTRPISIVLWVMVLLTFLFGSEMFTNALARVWKRVVGRFSGRETRS